MSEAAITWVTAHPHGRWVAVGQMSGRILIWAPGEERIVAQQKLSSRILRVEWTADAKYLVAIEEEGDALHVFVPDGSTALPSIETKHEAVRALAVHPSKPWVATAGRDSHVRVWDLEKRTAIYEKKTLHPGSACALSETLVAVGSEIGEFDVWDFLAQKPKAGGELFRDAYVGAMAFSPDGKALVIAGSKGKVLCFSTSDKWTCTHEWKDIPPRPIATNDIRFRDDLAWLAAHSDDRATLFERRAVASPAVTSDLGTPFWSDRKTAWDREHIVSASCFVPGTGVVFTAHFSGRLRVFAKSVNGIHLRRGDVVFDEATGAPKTFGPIAGLFARARTPEPSTANAVAIGDREHAARSIDEMHFAASLHSCSTCGASPRQLVSSGEGEARTLRGDCTFCGRPATFTFFFRPGPEETASAILEPRALTAELERLTEAGIDDRTRGRALTCIVELLKFPLVSGGERGDALRAERDRLRAELTDDPLATNVDAIVRALFFSGEPPKGLGDLEKVLRIRAPIDLATLWPNTTSEVALDGFVTKIAVRPIWDIHHRAPPKSDDELRQCALFEWCVVFASGAVAFQQALRRAYGPPNVRPHCHVYGKHWVVRTRGDAIELTWGQRIPDWAHHVEPNVRERALVALAEALANGADPAQAAGAIPPDAGIVPRDSSSGTVSLELAPAMSILELARIFGWGEIIGQSRDVHASVHAVELLSGGPPKLGRFTVDITIEGSPTGEPLDRTIPIHLWKRRFGPKDLVRYWQIRG